MKRAASALFLLLCFVASGAAQSEKRTGRAPQDVQTERYFNSIRQKPPLLLAFLREMPKGGDLHIHFSGALYAESLINYSADDGLCVDRTTAVLSPPPCPSSCDRFNSNPPVACAYDDHVLYNTLVDGWSMRNFHAEEESGHDHFFATFDKFNLATKGHTGDSMAEVARRAAADHLQYIEVMHTADAGRAARLGSQAGWEDDFATLRAKLLASGMKDAVEATRKSLDDNEAKMRSVFHCGTPTADAGCGVTMRYLYQVLRGLPKEIVFAQILLGFELASTDPRVVGLNLVMPEDWYVPMHDFHLHMQMLNYLHGVYPKVHISLHAGELAAGLVPPEGLRFHIRESVELGHAERIGHGVAVMHEDDAVGLLREMAKKKVLVEICLTSNDVILGVRGAEHPLSAYRQYGVPVALATDDQGVARSDMTQEYLRAARDQGLSYADLKTMARQSLEHSFLPGASLWAETQPFRVIAACGRSGSPACEKFLADNEKARVQMKLEMEFEKFEAKY